MMNLEIVRRFPFVVHADPGCIVQALPSGFSVTTPHTGLFIDGGTHLVHFGCVPTWEQWEEMIRRMEAQRSAEN